MVKDHRDSHMGYSFQLAARDLLYASTIEHNTTAFVEHLLEWEKAQ